MNNPADAASDLNKLRPRFEFTIPDSERAWPTDPKQIVMREVTVAEEQLASVAASGQGIKYVYEAIKHSIIGADGKTIGWDAGGKELFLEGCSPKVRDLLTKAYHRLHLPKDESVVDFLGSMKTLV